jgi:hypothetical protein
MDLELVEDARSECELADPDAVDQHGSDSRLPAAGNARIRRIARVRPGVRLPPLAGRFIGRVSRDTPSGQR